MLICRRQRHDLATRAATAELKQAASLIPDAAMLLNTLPTLEAQASSQIENIFTTADALFQHAFERYATQPD